MNERKQWVSRSEALPLTSQCKLTCVARSTVYAPELVTVASEEELELLGLIDAEYTRHPFYGSRKIRRFLCDLGYKINRKRVQRLRAGSGLIIGCLNRWIVCSYHRAKGFLISELNLLIKTPNCFI